MQYDHGRGMGRSDQFLGDKPVGPTGVMVILPMNFDTGRSRQIGDFGQLGHDLDHELSDLLE